jgi:hypothetical protein
MTKVLVSYDMRAVERCDLDLSSSRLLGVALTLH